MRRPTGGRSVLHWRELTYAVALPASALGPRDAYHWINTRLAAALASLGVPAKIATAGGPAMKPDAGPCFQAAAPGEVEVEGRKLVGSAQVRVLGTYGDALLQHGSILIEDDQKLLAALGIPGDVGAPAALGPLLGRPLAEGELESALLAGFGACEVEPAPASPREPELVERYRSDEWTWRC